MNSKINMNLSLAWLFLVLAASWSGWLLAGRTEVATLLMGCGMIILAGLEFLATESGRRLRTLPALGMVTGAGILCAGVFDRLDIGRFSSMTDWLTGFVVGAAVAGAMLFWLIKKDQQGEHGSSLGEIPLAHWDALWIALGFTLWLVADAGFNRWFELRGLDEPDWLRASTCSLVWVLVAASVQGIRFGRLHLARLLLAAGSPAVFFLADYFDLGWPTLFLVVILFWAMCCSGGSYPLRWPSGTFGDGWIQVRSWLLTSLIAVGMTTNISASLTNATVTDVVASHGMLAPLSEASFARLVTSDAYLWSDESSSARDDDQNSRPLLKGMRVADRDRFSVAWTVESEARWSPRKGNPGVFVSRQGGQTLVAHVIPGSPADKAGIARGWRLLPRDSGESDTKKADGFAFISPGDVRMEVREAMDSEPLVDFHVDTESGRPIGYLYLNGFDPTAREALDRAFAEFRRARVKELVVDLRYNPGGAITVVSQLASLIAGNQHAGEVLYRISHNPKYSDADEVGRFKRNPNGLDLARVFVLTSENSCSASELLIVSLRPYLPVITIGEVTCGKPFGSVGVRFGNQVFRVLSIRSSDAKGQGFYLDGLVPKCLKADDLKQKFKLGTLNDPMFGIAQQYIETGLCA